MTKESSLSLEMIRIPKKEYEDLLFKYEDLSRQFSELKRLVFGAKSERYILKINPDQISLFESEAVVNLESEKTEITYVRNSKKAEKQQAIRTAIPSHLLRVEQIIEPEFIAPNSVKIGEEVTEILEMTPASIFVRRIIRPKYKQKDNYINIAELPSLPIPKGNAGASLLAYILVSKFVDHLPLYRLRQIFKREGLDISPSTISGWSSKMGELLAPLYHYLKKELLEQSDYLQVDESPIKVQDKDKKGSLHQGYMWVYRNPIKQIIVFNYNKARAKEVPKNFLQDFKGTLQTDGYKAYQSLSHSPEIDLLGCMAHARRYFEKALDNDTKRAEHVLFELQKLYAMERKIKNKDASVELIKRYRQKYAVSILDELKVWLLENKEFVYPKSTIAKAINYMLNIFDNLKRYTNDGRFEIDNNNIENAIRPLAIGRKNYLFAGSHQTAQHYAMFYSLFATCKINNVNPFKWIHYVIDNISEHKANKLNQLLPHNCKIPE